MLWWKHSQSQYKFERPNRAFLNCRRTPQRIREKAVVLMMLMVMLMLVMLMLMVAKLIGRIWIFIEFLLFDGHCPIFHRNSLSGLGSMAFGLT